MEDFRYKARLVVGGHITEASAIITHASVVSNKTMRIALMISALNDLELKSGNILNVYVEAQFGKDARKTALILRALYGLK